MDDPRRDAHTRALAVVRQGRPADTVREALETLPRGDPSVREAVLARYRRIAAAPGRLDADCALRTALLQGLRSCAVVDDRGLLERATQTYEYRSAGETGEVAANLRAAALLALSQVDDRAAGFHAVRLLQEAAWGSGEPALTAARLLVDLGEPLPLYASLLSGGVDGEVAAECFHALVGAPDSVLLGLAGQWSDSADEVGLLGFLDAVLETLAVSSEPEPFEAVLLRFLRDSTHLDLVRYLATAIVARRRTALIAALREGPWPSPTRRGIVEEALALLPER